MAVHLYKQYDLLLLLFFTGFLIIIHELCSKAAIYWIFFFWKPCMIKFNWSVDFMFQHLAFSRSWNEEEDKEVDRCWTVGVSDLISVVSQYEREREGNQKSAREHQADRPRGWATVSPCPHHCFLLHVAFPVWSGCWALVQWHCCLLYPAVHTSHSWRVL